MRSSNLCAHLCFASGSRRGPRAVGLHADRDSQRCCGAALHRRRRSGRSELCGGNGSGRTSWLSGKSNPRKGLDLLEEFGGAVRYADTPVNLAEQLAAALDPDPAQALAASPTRERAARSRRHWAPSDRRTRRYPAISLSTAGKRRARGGGDLCAHVRNAGPSARPRHPRARSTAARRTPGTSSATRSRCRRCRRRNDVDRARAP